MSRGNTGADGTTEDDPDRQTSLDRRSFVRSALAVGGTGALSSVVDLFGRPDTAVARTTSRSPPGCDLR